MNSKIIFSPQIKLKRLSRLIDVDETFDADENYNDNYLFLSIWL